MRNIKAEKIVIKIGTNTLTDGKGRLDMNVLKSLVGQISRIKNHRKKIVVITSGAIGSGMKELGLKKKPEDVVMKQVCAGIGQGILMANYHALFRKYGVKIAQVLLTYDDFRNRKTSRNLRNSLNRMLELGVIAIINENDPISIDEIGASFGDNDNLSALIAECIKADLLLILTDVEGLYDRDPKQKGAALMREVRNIDKRIESMSGKASNLGLGGMKTKIDAAKKATSRGTTVVVANGKRQNVIVDVLSNKEIGTLFYAK